MDLIDIYSIPQAVTEFFHNFCHSGFCCYYADLYAVFRSVKGEGFHRHACAPYFSH